MRTHRVAIAIAIMSLMAAACTGSKGPNKTTPTVTQAAESSSDEAVATESGSRGDISFVGETKVRGSFTGKTEDPNTFVGLVTDGDGILAYFCDGKGVSSWFRGPVLPGGVTITNAAGAKLSATFTEAGATGEVSFANGRTLTFQADPANTPAGLYRDDETRNDIRRLSGWITLGNGDTKGLGELSLVGSLVPVTTLAPKTLTTLAPVTTLAPKTLSTLSPVIGGLVTLATVPAPVAPVVTTVVPKTLATLAPGTLTTLVPAIGGLVTLATIPAPVATVAPTATTKATTATTTTSRPPTTTTSPTSLGSPTPNITGTTLIEVSPIPPLDRLVIPDPIVLQPPTPNPGAGNLRFVLAAMGDSFAAGEGAPDVNGVYTKSNLRQCRDEANGFSAYTEAEFAALGSITSLPARAMISANSSLQRAAELQGLVQTMTAAQQAKTNAEAALAAIGSGDVTGALTNATEAFTAAAATLTNASNALNTAATAVTNAVVTLLGTGITTSSAFVNTGRSGPFALLGIFTPSASASLRFATFFLPYTGCNQRPPVRIDNQRELWSSAFTQSRPVSPALPNVVDSDAQRCHRSMNAPAALAARQLALDLPDVNVVYKSFACSGAHTKHIDTSGYNGVEFTPAQFQATGQLPPQIDQLATWARANSMNTIDSVYLGIGGNDVGFGLIILACILPYLDLAGIGCESLAPGLMQGNANESGPLAGREGMALIDDHFLTIKAKIDSLDPTNQFPLSTQLSPTLQIGSLLDRFNTVTTTTIANATSSAVRIGKVHSPSLPDVTRDQNRVPCRGQTQLGPNDRDISDRLGASESQFAAAQIVPQLDGAIRNAASGAGFGVIDLRNSFGPHGFCSTDPWLNNNNRATAIQNALIGKVENTGFPNPADIRAIAGPTATLIPGPVGGSTTAGDPIGDNVSATIGGQILPFAGMHLSFGIIHPNATGYRLGYLPPTLAAVRADARAKFTPKAPDQLRSSVLSATSIRLGWRDRADNEVTYSIRSSPTTACGLPTPLSLDQNAQTVTVTVSANTNCNFLVKACGIRMQGQPLCSVEVPVRASTVPPAAPTGLTVATSGSDTASKAQLAWTAVPEALQYVAVLRSTAPSSPLTTTVSEPLVALPVTTLEAILPGGGATLPAGSYLASVRTCTAFCGLESAPVAFTVGVPIAATVGGGTTTSTSGVPTSVTSTSVPTTLAGSTSQMTTSVASSTVASSSVTTTSSSVTSTNVATTSTAFGVTTTAISSGAPGGVTTAPATSTTITPTAITPPTVTPTTVAVSAILTTKVAAPTVAPPTTTAAIGTGVPTIPPAPVTSVTLTGAPTTLATLAPTTLAPTTSVAK